jgi:flagellar basal-body rod protein FlgG
MVRYSKARKFFAAIKLKKKECDNMINGLYTAASGLIAETYKQDVIANNLANVNTTGYKKDKALYITFPTILLYRLYDDKIKVPGAQEADVLAPIGEMGRGVQLRYDGIQPAITEEGSFIETQNKLNFAIKGNGMFVINTPYGIRYTRDGSFLIDNENKLVTQSGYPVLGQRGEITIEGTDIHVDEAGTIFVDGQEIDNFRIGLFDEQTKLRKQGENLFYVLDGGLLPENEEGSDIQVRQGYLETSNVNVVKEMVDMITAYRAYEASQKAIQAQDQTLNRAVNDVGNVTI